MTLKVDAHQHFWKWGRAGYDYSWMDAEPLAPIHRDFLPADLKSGTQSLRRDWRDWNRLCGNVLAS